MTLDRLSDADLRACIQGLAGSGENATAWLQEAARRTGEVASWVSPGGVFMVDEPITLIPTTRNPATDHPTGLSQTALVVTQQSMGQNRTDTSNQRAAKQRVADRRQCPRCLRRSALSTPIYDEMGKFRQCHYCGHQVGTYCGGSYGRDVTPEPGTTVWPATDH